MRFFGGVSARLRRPGGLQRRCDRFRSRGHEYPGEEGSPAGRGVVADVTAGSPNPVITPCVYPQGKEDWFRKNLL